MDFQGELRIKFILDELTRKDLEIQKLKNGFTSYSIQQELENIANCIHETLLLKEIDAQIVIICFQKVLQSFGDLYQMKQTLLTIQDDLKIIGVKEKFPQNKVLKSDPNSQGHQRYNSNQLFRQLLKKIEDLQLQVENDQNPQNYQLKQVDQLKQLLNLKNDELKFPQCYQLGISRQGSFQNSQIYYEIGNQSRIQVSDEFLTIPNNDYNFSRLKSLPCQKPFKTSIEVNKSSHSTKNNIPIVYNHTPKKNILFKNIEKSTTSSPNNIPTLFEQKNNTPTKMKKIVSKESFIKQDTFFIPKNEPYLQTLKTDNTYQLFKSEQTPIQNEPSKHLLDHIKFLEESLKNEQKRLQELKQSFNELVNVSLENMKLKNQVSNQEFEIEMLKRKIETRSEQKPKIAQRKYLYDKSSNQESPEIKMTDLQVPNPLESENEYERRQELSPYEVVKSQLQIQPKEFTPKIKQVVSDQEQSKQISMKQIFELPLKKIIQNEKLYQYSKFGGPVELLASTSLRKGSQIKVQTPHVSFEEQIVKYDKSIQTEQNNIDQLVQTQIIKKRDQQNQTSILQFTQRTQTEIQRKNQLSQYDLPKADQQSQTDLEKNIQQNIQIIQTQQVEYYRKIQVDLRNQQIQTDQEQETQHLSQKINLLEAQNKFLTNQLYQHSLRDNDTQLSEYIAELEQQISLYKQNIIENQMKFQDDFKQIHRDHQSKVQDMVQKINERDLQLNQLDRENKQIELALNNMKINSEQQSDMQKSLIQQISTLQDELNREKMIHKQTSEELKRYQFDLLSSQNQLEFPNSTPYKQVRSQIQSLKDENQNFTNQIQNLQRQFEEKEKQVETLINKKCEGCVQLKQLNQNLEKQLANYAKLELPENPPRSDEQIQELKLQLQKLNEEHESLKKFFQDQNSIFKTPQPQQENEVSDYLVNRVKQLEDQNQKYEKLIQELKINNCNLQLETEEKIKYLEKQIFQGQQVEQKDQKYNLEQKISEIMEKLQTKQILVFDEIGRQISAVRDKCREIIEKLPQSDVKKEMIQYSKEMQLLIQNIFQSCKLLSDIEYNINNYKKQDKSKPSSMIKSQSEVKAYSKIYNKSRLFPPSAVSSETKQATLILPQKRSESITPIQSSPLIPPSSKKDSSTDQFQSSPQLSGIQPQIKKNESRKSLLSPMQKFQKQVQQNLKNQGSSGILKNVVLPKSVNKMSTKKR